MSDAATIWRQTWVIVRKDLRRELRSREVTLTTVSFSVLLMVIFAFSFYQNDATVGLVFPGILWVAIVFTGTLTITRSFADEKESGCLRALALIPGTHMSLYLGKLLINLLFMAIFEAALIPLLVLAFGVPVGTIWQPMLGAVAAGTFGFAALGTLLSAMLVHHRLREVLVPLLLYPLLVPLLIGGVKVVGLLLEPLMAPQAVVCETLCKVVPAAVAPVDHSAEVGGWLRAMLGMDLVFSLMGAGLFRWALDAVE